MIDSLIHISCFNLDGASSENFFHLRRYQNAIKKSKMKLSKEQVRDTVINVFGALILKDTDMLLLK